MTILIKEDDLIQSISDSVQFISYYHPIDFLKNLERAYKKEMNHAARDAILQILTNSRMCAEGKRPICQDTGIVNVFIQVGMNVKFKTNRSLQDICDHGIRIGYMNSENPLRASIVSDPLFNRKNTGDNTPCILHVQLVPGNTVIVHISAKGGGSENQSKFVMLNPNDSIEEWVLKTVPTMGAGWCPPGILGIGVGGTSEYAMLLAKKSLLNPIDMYELLIRGPKNPIESLRIDLYKKVNSLGIGAQGLGGLSTVLDVKIKTFPTHSTSKPVAMIPNCAATRHTHFVLTGNGPAKLEPPLLSEWPEVNWIPDKNKSIPINLETLTKNEVENWKTGQTLLLSGRLFTARDAAHKRMMDLIHKGKQFPVNLKNRVIYYVGPVTPVRDEVVGPAGPTTASRMDNFTDMMFSHAGVISMIGKSERNQVAIQSIKKHRSAYLIAVGGAAYIISKAIKSARVISFSDLGMEAIYEFYVLEMPVTVAVDSKGTSLHMIGPTYWKNIISKLST